MTGVEQIFAGKWIKINHFKKIYYFWSAEGFWAISLEIENKKFRGFRRKWTL